MRKTTGLWYAYYRNYAQWQKIADSLYAIAKIDNEAALGTFNYNNFISIFLEREREKLSDQEYLHREAFYREWYHTDTIEGKKQFNADHKNLPQEKIITKYFSGSTAEYLYAILISGAITAESNPNNVPEIFGRFKAQYPNSGYVAKYSPLVDAVIARQKQALNSNMVFMADNGSKINTLNEVLAAMKGKTVLVDMWGTWCGPCREEIEKNSAAIREHFKNKGLTYLYIANNDLNNQQQWKKLIAYFDIEGTHLLASQALTNDIMAKLKSNGYPTVFVIKKDGSYEPSKTGYPITLSILYKQLEGDLAE